jgi:predicted nucleic acid-binding protein
MQYLLDSDWIINLLAGKADAQKKIERIDPNEIGISIVTVAEIYESAYHFANLNAHIEQFDSFLKSFGVIDSIYRLLKYLLKSARTSAGKVK